MNDVLIEDALILIGFIIKVIRYGVYGTMVFIVLVVLSIYIDIITDKLVELKKDGIL